MRAGIEHGLALLDAAVDELLSAEVSGLGGAALAQGLERLERVRRRLEGVDQRLLMQANDSAWAAAVGRPGMAAALADLLRIEPRIARRRVRRALDLAPRRSLTGESLPPSLPLVAEAVADGDVSPEQCDVILDALEHVPPCAPAPAWPVVERVLVEAARSEAPQSLRRTAVELLARLDPDGVEPAEDKAERLRGFTLVKHPDGTASPRGRWTAETTAAWEAILDGLAAPQPADDDGTPDPRSAPQRRHDAMGEAARRLLRSDTLPAAGGTPVTVLATTTIRELSSAAGLDLAGLVQERTGLELADVLATGSSGLALLGHGQTVSARSLLAMACEAEVVPVVFNDAGGVLAFGRTRRLASRDQRLALAARDGGCSFPGCDRPAAWSEVHHVVEWAAGGPTDIGNLCLVCAFHHRSFEKAGWRVVMRDGVPEWIPPPWLDPAQRPRRNRVHHRPEFEFRPPTAA